MKRPCQSWQLPRAICATCRECREDRSERVAAERVWTSALIEAMERVDPKEIRYRAWMNRLEREAGMPEVENDGLQADVVARSGVAIARTRHDDPGAAAHIARWDPARVLAEVAAKRAILDRWALLQERIDNEPDPVKRERLALTRHGLDFAVHVLVQPHVGHPAFHPSWSTS